MLEIPDINAIDWKPYLETLKRKPPMRRGRRIPYVAFGFIGMEWKTTEPVPEVRFSVLPMDGCHANEYRIDQYVLKGHKLLDWWFPEKLTREDEDKFGAKPHTYKLLAERCARLKNSDPAAVKAMMHENEIMRKKIEELELQAAKKGK